MSHGPGCIQRQMLQVLRDRRIAVDTAELARLVYLERELSPAQRVAAWRALDGLEQRGLVIRRSRRGRCYWCANQEIPKPGAPMDKISKMWRRSDDDSGHVQRI
jgi:hypothetical protein